MRTQTRVSSKLKSKKVLAIIVISALALLGLFLFLFNYMGFGSSPLQPGNSVFIDSSNQSETNFETNFVDYELEVFATGLRVPWSMVFTSPNRLLLTERPGRIRLIENGVLSENPLHTFPEVLNTDEEGLMGIALDPQYEINQQLYVCIAYEKNFAEPSASNTISSAVKVVRMTDAGTKLIDEQIIIDNIPVARFHAGCRLRFGPDNKLYISTGDASNKESAQDLNSLSGKILRVNADGSIPADNPFPNSAIFSYGHRNPQGFDWHPESGVLVATEHGPSGNDGPRGGDEVNIIEAGNNYGWPIVSHEKSQEGLINPLILFTPAEAPGSGMFYRGSVFPQFTNTFLFGVLRGEGIIQVVFDDNAVGKVVSYQKLPDINVGRVRDIVEAPDGTIYFSTSNTDGRGQVYEGDDHIYRLIPKNNNLP
ncbi:MAG: PQQ-dependent sugar dehydrogenase [Candidatus Pacebacteria bacterium]|nr:PQQ-dependent sugar dehydrogenase [Candidatus Paceibacterota bacterium]